MSINSIEYRPACSEENRDTRILRHALIFLLLFLRNAVLKNW